MYVDLSDQAWCMQDCAVLLAWNALVVRQLELPAAKKAVDKLLECQVCN